MKTQPLIEITSERDLLVNYVKWNRGWKKEFYKKKLVEYDQKNLEKTK
jgi:hypothetical protein